MRRRIAALACVLALSSCEPVHASIPHYELASELTGEFPIEAYFEQQLEYRKPSMHQRLERFLCRRKVQNHKYYAALIARADASLDEKFTLAAMLPVESHGNPNAVSCKGAVGPWQIMPGWKKVLKIPGSLKDPVVNMKYALRVYRIHLVDAKGKRDKALVFYSGGARGYSERIRLAKLEM